MSILTPFFNLIKPAKTDGVKVSDFNANMDTIDTEMHKPPLTINGIEPDPTTRNLYLEQVPLADNLASDIAQINNGDFVIRTSGGDTSIEDGAASLVTIKGNMVKTGYVPEELTMTVTPATREEGVDPITATIDRDTFVAYVVASGTITLTYTTAWSADPADYGITVEGTPIAGDVITVVYVKEERGTITTAQPTAFCSTGWNLYDNETGYARVVAYSTQYGYRIGGTYSLVDFSTTLTGTRTAVTVQDGLFNVSEDGYIFITNGDATTYIYPTWTDWTETYGDGHFEAYTVDTIDLSEAMLLFPYGLLAVGNTRDEINLNVQRCVQRIERIAYTAENLESVIESGVDYDTDTNYIYAVLEDPVSTAITIDGGYTVSDHGIEFFTGTTVPCITETLYGENLKDKLRTDVVTISEQTLTDTQKAQVRSNINAANGVDFTNFQLRTLSGSSVDLDNLYNRSDNGLYYISTGVTNSPSNYSGLIVIGVSGAAYQICIGANGILYYRKRVGNPLAWSVWVSLGTQTTGTVTKQSASITDANFHFTEEVISGTMLLVSGYFNCTTAIYSNTNIASVSIKPKTQVFASVVSSGGKTGRFVLTTGGIIKTESILEANSGYYSMTFVSNYV